MTLGYHNSLAFTRVVQDQNPTRDPYVSWRLHRERGSLGGVDLVATVGTRLYAPADCTLRNRWAGTGGHTVVMEFADRWRDEFMHLSQFVEPGPRRQGELVGLSGASGPAGTPPHVHWHRVDPDGVRRIPWDYFDTDPDWAFTPPVASEQVRIQRALTALGLYDGALATPWGAQSVRSIQRSIATVGYLGPADGQPGPNTCHYVQVYARTYGQYLGPVDRVLGPRSWLGYAAGVEFQARNAAETAMQPRSPSYAP